MTGTQASGPGRLDGALDAVRAVRTATARNARVMMILSLAVLGMVGSVNALVPSALHPNTCMPFLFLLLGVGAGGLQFLSSCLHWSLHSY